MSAFATDGGQISRRSVVFALIVALHLFIGWAFVSGFGKQVVAKIIDDVKIEQIIEDKKDEAPPPPPKVDLNLPPPVAMPPPVVDITVPVDLPPPVRTEIRATPPPPRPSIPGTPLVLVKPPNPDDFYPEQSRRLGEEGTAVVQICVGSDAKFEGAPAITTSSGSENLDAAALRWAKSVRQARAATSDGKPVRACKGFKIVFKNPDARH